MAQMGAAVGAVHFGATRQQLAVHFGADGGFVDRLKIAGPAAMGLKFGAGVKQGLAATDASVDARRRVALQFAAVGAFGGFVARDLESQLFGTFFLQQGLHSSSVLTIL